MYENKVLVSIYIVSLSKNFEIFIPINEKVGNIAKLLSNTLIDSIDLSRNNVVMNMDSGVIYKNNDIVRATDIRNDTKLVLL
jgi:hypothetical protein